MRASDYPPPFRADEFVAGPTDPADERIEVGVLIVGAGPAGLACAIRLGQLLEEHPEVAEKLGEVPVAVLERASRPVRICCRGRCSTRGACASCSATASTSSRSPTTGRCRASRCT